ncbi:MAG: hypothetical protein WCI02_13220 [Planctomycetota bacterium]
MNTDALQVANSMKPVWFFGCDMGGWHTRSKDALAICRWTPSGIDQHFVDHGRLFFPLSPNSRLINGIEVASKSNEKVIIAIDAALAWPRDFLRLAVSSAKASHLPDFDPNTGQIQNRYMFRETERFIKQHVRKSKDPFSAPGDAFGNPSSKAQAVVAAILNTFPQAYRPPFDPWDLITSNSAAITVIEVYPAASQVCRRFMDLRWCDDEDTFRDLSADDENDAKRCSVTAMCYAKTIGILHSELHVPEVWLPNEAGAEFDAERIRKEGWIFAPKIDVR